jgi:7-cyano-7-deazaguanine synthase
MSQRKKVIFLLSGGMDSVTAIYDTARRHDVIGALSFHYGSKHNNRELPFAAHHCKALNVPHVVIPLAFIGEHFESALLNQGREIPKGHYEEQTMKQTVVPFRNGIMLSIASGFAESKNAQGVVIAAHAGDHAIYPDCREAFMLAMGDAIRLGTYAGVELMRPFIQATKAQIAARGYDLGVDYSQTWSCYIGGDLHCGECGTCVERREAFVLAGVPDPTVYASTPPLPPKPQLV